MNTTRTASQDERSASIRHLPTSQPAASSRRIPLRNVLGNAIADIGQGLGFLQLSLALAREDIGDQYRRTSIGPTWLLVNYLAFAETFILIFHPGRGGVYPAYVATGLLVWFYLVEVMNQAIVLFSREEALVKGTSLPTTVYIMRLSLQLLLRGGYSLVGCVIILVLHGAPLYPGSPLALIGIALLVVATPALVTVFALASVFFPDVKFLLPHLLRLGLFLTPVFWMPGSHHDARSILYQWNPFTYFLETVRIPIMTGHVSAFAIVFCATVELALWVLALVLLGRLRREIVFAL